MILATGCAPTFHGVSGLVTLDGKPLAGAAVTYIPEGPGQPSVATADESGRYTLETINTAGVKPGTYKVVVTKIAFTPVDERTGVGGQPLPSPVPAKYTKVETSGLSITVPATGEGAYDLKLESK